MDGDSNGTYGDKVDDTGFGGTITRKKVGTDWNVTLKDSGTGKEVTHTLKGIETLIDTDGTTSYSLTDQPTTTQSTIAKSDPNASSSL